MHEITQFRNSDLLLQVPTSLDPSVLDLSKYEQFLDALCGNREYQKDAIRTLLRLFLGGRVKSQEDLARLTWSASPILRAKYPAFDRLRELLPFPHQLAADVDLATGSGKSFVMYGVARIMLSAGAAKQVLVLCPSTTIEAGLTDKFRALSADADLTATLPADSAILVPHIINATESVIEGSICIENIHATYRAARSSIRETLVGKGRETLVLNDEVHHVYSPDPRDESLKKWKEFIQDSAFGFRFVAGFSGTCYSGNDYFPSVVARYSLTEAMDDGVVKGIEYVAEGATGDQDEKFQKIYDNHAQAKRRYRAVRPLTIFVTKDIQRCEEVAEDFVKFLIRQEKCTRAAAEARILIVTSNKKHAANLVRLRANEPDSSESKIEWLFSVSMLTEGWDVQNVFQIVPHEERAFNSKLLIAQVLGRGLRLPPAYATDKPKVIVFNHDRWSAGIKHLVDEILELERRLASWPVEKEPDYNFDIDHIAYERTEKVVETPQVEEYNFEMEVVDLTTQQRVVTTEDVYVDVHTGDRRTKRTTVSFEMIPIEDAVNQVFNKFKAIDLEEDTSYAKTYPKERVRNLIRRSLDKIGYEGNELSRENRQRILSKFGNLNRAGSRSIRYSVTPAALDSVSTKDRQRESVAVAMLRRTASVFFDEKSIEADEELGKTLTELEEEEELGAKRLARVANSFNFKTPLSIAIALSEPERRFIKGLVSPETAKCLQSWVKSTDSGFYEIEYSYSKGEYSKRAVFNPDFFVKTDVGIVVVEIKDDGEVDEPSAENRGKLKAARTHVSELNKLQTKTAYHFCFLTPKNFDAFFQSVADRKHMTFRSALDVALSN
ncbi:MAG: DEAD/DEAH box helicase family protein [Candidatus Thermoplasmatota archaeon]|jgi:type III restriction enzyme